MHPVFILCQSESCPWIYRKWMKQMLRHCWMNCVHPADSDRIITDIDLDLNPKVEKKY